MPNGRHLSFYDLPMTPKAAKSVIQARNKAMSDVNTSFVGTLVTWLPILTLTNEPTAFTVLSNAIKVSKTGLFLITASLYTENGAARNNPAIEITRNGLAQGVRGASGYKRMAGGHNEGSSHITQLVSVSAGDEIGVLVRRMANGGAASAPQGRSVLILQEI